MRRLILLLALALASATAACAPAAPLRCHRYDSLALTRENGFSASLDWKGPAAVDTPSERVDVAITVLRPLRGPIDLVHVVGDLEADRWVLTPPDQNNVAPVDCWIAPSGAPSNCGATLQDLPYFPSGYYCLRANGNTVLEAGLAFYICD